MKNIKIAHLSTVNGSMKAILLNKLIGLKEKGYEVHAISSPGIYEDEIKKNEIIFHSVAISRNISLVNDIKSTFKMISLFKKERFDIVHTHTAKAGFIGRISAKIAGVPIIIHTSHGLPFYEGQRKIKFHTYKTLEKIAGKFTDVIFSQNKEDIENITRYKLINREHVLYEGNGVNIEKLDDLADMTDKAKLKKSIGINNEIIIGFYSRMEPVKGHLFFLECFKEVTEKRNNIICVLAGNGLLEEYIKKSIKELSLENNIRFLGHRKDIPKLLSITDILILPSEKEGIPRIVMEAMTLGVPVVATDVLGTRELVNDKETGILIPYKEKKALKKALIMMIDNQQIRIKFGVSGRRRIEQYYDERQVVERINEVYKKLIKEKLSASRLMTKYQK